MSGIVQLTEQQKARLKKLEQINRVRAVDFRIPPARVERWEYFYRTGDVLVDLGNKRVILAKDGSIAVMC